MAVAINLNDRYGLDGRNPNAYTGSTWSTGGVHGKGRQERLMLNKKYRSHARCTGKFDVKQILP
ncbi:MAG: hypothetical protein AMJ61_13260 [Desulfobacterales bacterium SG8_35_2]|nr:MAG: hypothetical protein AMJ61_13260 [Desulfobacterales bacterium SG8_35_2]